MQHDKRWYLPFFIVIMGLLVACGGGTPPAEAQNATPRATATAVYYDTVLPTRTPRPTRTPNPTRIAANATQTVVAATDSAPAISGGITFLNNLDAINSYRFSIEIKSEGAAFEGQAGVSLMGGVLVEGAIVKEPPAQDFTITFATIPGSSGVRIVGGQAFSNLNGEWSKGSTAAAPDIEGLLPLTAAEITPYLNDLEVVGNEAVDGRPATHYLANQAALVAIAEAQGAAGAANYARADDATADIWVDQEGGFVSKMDLVVEGAGVNPEQPDAEGRLEIHVEYYDINEDINIDVPDLSAAASGSGGSGSGGTTDTATVADLLALLGFDIDLPPGTTVEILYEVASVTVPLSLADTQPLFINAFEANGYELDEENSLTQFGYLQYNGSRRKWLVTFTADGRDTVVLLSPVVEE